MNRIATALLGLGLMFAVPQMLHARPGGHRDPARMLEGLKEEAGLTDEQAAKVKQVFAANKDARHKAHADQKAAMANMEALTAGKSTDEKAYQAQLDNLANAKQALQSLRQQETASLKTILKPSQQARLVLRLKHKAREHFQPGGGPDVDGR